MFQPVEILNFPEALRLTERGRQAAFEKYRRKAEDAANHIKMSKCHDGVWRHLQRAQRFHNGGVFSQYVDNAEYIINPNR